MPDETERTHRQRPHSDTAAGGHRALPDRSRSSAMLWVGSYAKVDPTFIGIPFFYWYQMLWVLDLRPRSP